MPQPLDASRDLFNIPYKLGIQYDKLGMADLFIFIQSARNYSAFQYESAADDCKRHIIDRPILRNSENKDALRKRKNEVDACGIKEITF